MKRGNSMFYKMSKRFATLFVTACEEFNYESVAQTCLCASVFQNDCFVIVDEDSIQTTEITNDNCNTSIALLSKEVSNLLNQTQKEMLYYIGKDIEGYYNAMYSVINPCINVEGYIYDAPKETQKLLGAYVSINGECDALTLHSILDVMLQHEIQELGAFYIKDNAIRTGEIPQEMRVYAKQQVFENGEPVRVLRPGVPRDMAREEDYILKYEWKPEFRKIY